MVALATQHRADLDAAISGKTGGHGGSGSALYSAYNDTTGDYTRNTGCALSALTLPGLSAISVWHTTSSGGDPGAWSQVVVWGGGGKSIALTAAHITSNDPDVYVGDSVRFVSAQDNITVTATVEDAAFVSGTDVMLLLLSSDVTSGGLITPVKILPDNWRSRLPLIANAVTTATTHHAIPIWNIHKHREINVVAWYYMLASSGVFGWEDELDSAFDGTYSGWDEQVTVGNSGCPLFMAVNGDLVMLAGNSSSFLHYYKSDINTAMNALASGAALTVDSWDSYDDVRRLLLTEAAA